jgi:hypothetical protein
LEETGSHGPLLCTREFRDLEKETGHKAISNIFIHNSAGPCWAMLVSDHNLITENYADAGRITIRGLLDWAFTVLVSGNIMPGAVRGGSGEGHGLPLSAVPPTQNAFARLKRLGNNLCAATRLGVRFNNLNSGLTFTKSHHASTVDLRWVKQSSVAGITTLECGLRHHIPAVYQISRCEYLSTVRCHLMIYILTTGMR